VRSAASLALLILCALLAPAGARGQDPPPLLGINSDRGRIDLGMLAPGGAKVDFFERVDGRLVPVGTAVADSDREYPSAKILRAATWRCDRLKRRFTAVASAPDGRRTTADAETRTPDCRDRLEVLVPRRIARGAVLTVAVLDRFTLGGVRATVCAARQGAKERCKAVGLTAAAPTAAARFRAGGNAVWRVRVKHPAGTIRRVLTVGNAKRPADAAGLPGLLVTGDSLIQGVDAFLGDRLQTAFDVTSDTRPGTGLVKPGGLNWPALARSQAARLTPAVTVMSLGINDGVPIGGVKCCGAPWSAAYGRRVRGVMRTYARGAKGRVLWLTLPIPRDPRFAISVRAVNVAIRQAAVGQERVTLVEIDKLLTPGDQYRDAMPIGGRSVRVRAADGIHLSVAGARHVAGVVVATLRRFRATG
jgi:hypothetical protein